MKAPSCRQGRPSVDALPATPDRYRALLGLAAGGGLRWGECVGVRLDALDLDERRVRIERVPVEVAGQVTDKTSPKSRAGRRTVPLPPFTVELLKTHLATSRNRSVR